MKASLLTLLLFFSCLSFVWTQKKYMVKVTTLDNKVYKGLMFQVRDKDFLVLPNSVSWDFKVKENNIYRTRSFEFGIVKNIKIRKKGSVAKGAIIGFFVGSGAAVLIGSSIASNRGGRQVYIGDALIGLLAGSATIAGGTILGGEIGGSYLHKFEVKKDSTYIQSLKTELKKYEWYHADEGMMK
jgi:hypothetical protein